MRYTCSNCSYSMELVPGRKLPTKCPYCSKEGTLERVKSAQELINEVTEIMEDAECR